MKYFAVQRELAKNAISLSDSFVEITESDYLVFPVNLCEFNPEIMVPNMLIKRLTEEFLNANAWAFEFDPNEDPMKI